MWMRMKMRITWRDEVDFRRVDGRRREGREAGGSSKNHEGGGR